MRWTLAALLALAIAPGLAFGGDIQTVGKLISTVESGTPPLEVTSSTLVTNLNADLLDGMHASEIIAEASGEVRIPVEWCGVIDQPGSYFLKQNIEAAVNADCLEVTASHVTIDLSGYVISQEGGTTGVGVTDLGASLVNVTVRNGTIRGFGAHGIDLDGTTGAVVEKIRAIDNGDHGIRLGGDGSIVTGSTASGNGGDGIEVAGVGCVVSGNTATGNTGDGIGVVHGCTVTHNSVSDSGSNGISVGQGSTITGNSVRGSFRNGIFANTGSTVSGNTARGNNLSDSAMRAGIVVRCPGNLIGNTATDNLQNDILLQSPELGCEGALNLPPLE